MSNRLGGKQGTAYTGTNANQPPNVTFNNRPPTQFDINYSVNDFWLDESATGIHRIWVLVSLQGDMNSKGALAQWVQFGTGTVETLTGNNIGFPVGPDGLNNINVVGDTTTINIVGNPGTNTLTASAVGTGVLSTLTGDSGGPVSPLAGNIDILGTANVITVTGNPGTHTLTVDTGGHVATSYITNPATGTAVPAAGVLTFAGTGGINISAGGSTVTVSSSGVPVPICAFGAFKSFFSNNVTGDGTFYTVIFDSVIFDVGGNYNPGTGTFTAPTTGSYQFNYVISCQNITDQNSADTILLTPTFAYQPNLVSPVAVKRSDNIYSFSFAALIELSAGQTVNVQIAVGGGSNFKTINIQGAAAPANPIGTYFSGFRVDPAASFITGTETFHTDDGNNVTPDLAGLVNVTGTGGITTTGTVGSNTLTIHSPGGSCAFFANKTTTSANVTGDGTQYTVVFDHVFFDNGSNYNSGTGTFTAPATGVYQFVFCISLTNVNPTVINDVDVILTVNGGPQQYLQLNQGVVGDAATNEWSDTASYIISLNTGDTVQASAVDIIVSGPAKTVGVRGNNVNNNDPRTTFAGYRIA